MNAFDRRERAVSPSAVVRNRHPLRHRRALLALVATPWLSACSYVGAFVQAESPRTLFERGYFAEMMAIDGRPELRNADGLRVLVNLRYRPRSFASDERAHLLDAYVPASGTGPWPMIVYAHGGGLNAGDKDDETRVNRNMSIALANRGFVVLNINHRLVDEAPHPAQAEDMAAAVRWGIDHADELRADPDRLVLAGFSSGGYLAALMAADPRYLEAQRIDSRRLRGVAAVSGFFDIDHLAEPFLVRRFIVEPAFGNGHSSWRDASPLTYAAAHWPPTLLIRAAADRASGPQSDALCVRLRDAGVRCRCVVVPNSDHATAIARLGDGRATPQFEAMVEFLIDATRVEPRAVAGGSILSDAVPLPRASQQ